MLRLLASGLIVIALPLVVPVPAAQAASFGPTQTVVPPIRNVLAHPGAAINAQGRTAVVWTKSGRRGGLRVRLGRVTGRFSRTEVLSRTPVLDPAVALGADGTAAVVWVAGGRRGTRRLRVAVARPAHGFGRARTLATGRGRTTIISWSVVVGPDGRVVAVWGQLGRGGTIHAPTMLRFALRPAGRGFSKARNLAASGGHSVVSDTDGTTYVAWRSPLGEPYEHVAVAALAPTAREFGAPEIVSGYVHWTNDARLHEPSLFAGPGGVALGYAVGRPPKIHRLHVALRAPDGRFGSPRAVASLDPADGRSTFRAPAVGLPAGGPAVAVWSEFAGGLKAAIRGSDGSFGMPTGVSKPDAPVGFPLVAAAGSAVVAVWGEAPPRPRFYYEHRLLYATRPAGGPFTSPVPLTADRTHRRPALASAGRFAIAAWIADIGRSKRSLRVAVLVQ
jgi:hypothetical protein